VKVLLADDDALYQHVLRKALEGWGYEVITASNGNEALTILWGVDPPTLAILDWMMPGIDGVEVCRCVRERRQDPYTYIMLITAKSRKQDMITGLDAQADDYLIKPLDLQELRARLQSGQRIINLQSALASKQRELSYQATHDPLTGCWNRSAILDILGREVHYTKRNQRPLCLALADIDDFKFVNDTYGHTAGDTVLIEVVRRIQSALRPYDAVGRYGGEEFIVVMPGVNKQRAFKIVERLRMRVAENPYTVMKERISVTLSIGVAADARIGDAKSLLQVADEALYRAKASGRNRVVAAWARPVEVPIISRR
jgi:two-component system, cell cycle response regulator